MSDLAVAGESILGPSDDVVGELAVFVAVPDGIPTPTTATVTDATLSVYPYDLGGYYSAEIRFESDAPTSDLIAFYETTLTAAGYVQIGDTLQITDFGTTTTLRFTNPQSALDMADVAVNVSDYAELPDDVRLEFSDVASESDLLPFVGWSETLPLPPDGTAVSSWWNVSTLIFPSISVSLDIEYPVITPEELEQTFEAGLPTGGYALASEDVAGSTEMSSTSLYTASANYYAGYPDGSTADVTIGLEIDP